MISLVESESNFEAPFDTTRVLIEGVVENCTDEMINLYICLLLNANLDESFKVEEFRRNRQRVLLKFNRKFNFDDVVARQKKSLSYAVNLLLFIKLKSQTRSECLSWQIVALKRS